MARESAAWVNTLNRIDDANQEMRAGKLRLSREERDHVAGHALDSMKFYAEMLAGYIGEHEVGGGNCSKASRGIAALSNLLGDIGWEVEGTNESADQHVPPHEPLPETRVWVLGELFPVAQLRPWLEEWQRQDDEALVKAVEALRALEKESKSPIGYEAVEKDQLRFGIAAGQTKLGTGAILLARLEKWMACKEN